MKIIEEINSKGDGRFLLDVGGTNHYMAWVIDGATPIKDSKKWDNLSDTKWLVEKLNEKFLKLDPDTSAQSLNKTVRKCLNEIVNENEIQLNNIPEIEEPSFAIVVVAIRDNEIEYLVLGDCYLVVKSDSGVVVETDNRFIEFIEKNKKLYGQKKYSSEKRLRETRLKKNKNDGYWIGTLDGYGFEKTESKKTSNKNVHELILCSDGFARAVELFKIYSWEDLFNIELKIVFDKIREFEKLKDERKVYNRIKSSDDVWAIKIKL